MFYTRKIIAACVFVYLFVQSEWSMTTSLSQHRPWETFSFCRSPTLSPSLFVLFFLSFSSLSPVFQHDMTWHLIFCYNSFTTNSSLFSSFRAPAHTMYGSVLLFRRWLAFWILVHSKLSDSCWFIVHDKQCHSKNMQNIICMNKWCHLFRDNMLRWFPNEYEYISVSKTWIAWFMCKEFLIQRNFSLNRHRHISSYGNFLWFVGAFNFNLDKATFGTHTFTIPMEWNRFLFSV